MFYTSRRAAVRELGIIVATALSFSLVAFITFGGIVAHIGP